MAKLADHHEIFDWSHAVNWIEATDDRRPELLAQVEISRVPAANAAVADARSEILAAARTLPAGHKEMVQLLCVVADSITLWNDIGAYLAGEHTAGDQAGTALACRLEQWFYRYRLEWDKTSRVSATPRLIRLMNAWADCLRGRAYGTVQAPGIRT